MNLVDTGSWHRPDEPRTVLIVSPHFPPSSLAGVHRARHLMKHLPAHGWRPVALCVHERFHAEHLDQELAGLVGSDAEIIRCGAIPAWLMRPFGIGDISLRAFLHLRAAIARAIRRLRPDVVLVTGAPYFQMVLSGWIGRRFGVPVVLDFQDPWVSAWGAAQPPSSKAGVMHRIALRLEPHAVRGASWVTSVSERQNDELARRYPWFDPSRMEAIPIGGDPADFDAMRLSAPRKVSAELPADRINLSYLGTFLPRATPLVRALFSGLARLRQDAPELADNVCLNFVGTSAQPGEGGVARVLPIAEAEGVADLVRERPGRVPFLEALNIMANSDGLLLIGSDEPHYTASKIYPALMSGRPYLSLFRSDSSAHGILKAAGGGAALAFDSAALESEIARGLATLIAAPESLGKADPGAYEAFTACSVAGRFASVFDRVVQTAAVGSR